MISVAIAEVVEEHFGRSERTMMDNAPAALRNRLKMGEAVMFVSKTGKLIQFVFRDIGEATLSAKIRLPRPWSKDMIVNYGREAGLRITGLSSFEEFQERRARK